MKLNIILCIFRAGQSYLLWKMPAIISKSKQDDIWLDKIMQIVALFGFNRRWFIIIHNVFLRRSKSQLLWNSNVTKFSCRLTLLFPYSLITKKSDSCRYIRYKACRTIITVVNQIVADCLIELEIFKHCAAWK